MRKYKCSYCKKEFERIESVIRHINNCKSYKKAVENKKNEVD